MRKSSIPLQTQLSEPLIVVEESSYLDEECDSPCGPTGLPNIGGSDNSTPGDSSGDNSPTNPCHNPYLLSPFRDIRKHSLPTPTCSGITASQVRRLSERDNTVPGPKQTEFLATLSTAPAPVPGGRRHSVVTISKIPSTLFGRSRRESVANCGAAGRVLPSRRESITGPPSTEPRGSVHNLQLDIMDDIVQARKVRMKLWNTSSEKVCEVQPLDEAGGIQRYTHSSARRYSDFVGTTLAPIPSGLGAVIGNKRRASELPPLPAGGASVVGTLPAIPQAQISDTTITTTTPASSASKIRNSTGIVCTNTDLISILSSLGSSTDNVGQCEESIRQRATAATDVLMEEAGDGGGSAIAEVQVHQEVLLDAVKPTSPVVIVSKTTTTSTSSPTSESASDKTVLWDNRSGSIVDAEMFGSAIEDFLIKKPDGAVNASPVKGTAKTVFSKLPGNPKSWFAGTSGGKGGDGSKGEGQEGEDKASATCDSSLCGTLKDLFVK